MVCRTLSARLSARQPSKIRAPPDLGGAMDVSSFGGTAAGYYANVVLSPDGRLRLSMFQLVRSTCGSHFSRATLTPLTTGNGSSQRRAGHPTAHTSTVGSGGVPQFVGGSRRWLSY